MPTAITTPRAIRLVVEGQWTWYRRSWRASVVSSVLQPVLYLLALGIGVGTQIRPGGATGDLPYLQYLAPALVVASAVQTAAFESTFPVLSAFKWQRTYHGIAATPVSATQVALGQLAWVALRISVSAAAFLVVAGLLGALTSIGAVLSLVVATLTAVAFAAPVIAYSATIETEGQQFSVIFRFIVMPMTMFSGTFFPVEQLPEWVRPLVWLTPLWHGTELSRAVAFSTWEALGALGHLAFLLAMLAVGTHLAVRNFNRRLAI
ncbi:ABC transporter permease [Actinokineospora auranticolor]|uniref:Transport permease protein n=1 Tax=Actinokineospora auranticolor TaxID=155976 RepID=A0A2S6GV07_9PSEU|nr:ABC transporter permease [Actinokineospora auranticolor]PPK69058.1 lipooligosaccharide transport system permease protein [Actinokineospora auranticolor]